MANNDLNQIRIFSTVARLNSFTKAAQTLGIEKSTVSTKVAQLESRLGIRLLQRTTRSVSLTEAGSQYLGYCQQALQALESGDAFIAELSHVPIGRLRVSLPPDLLAFIFNTVISPFLQNYPKVALEMIQGNQNADLIEGQFDIAIRFEVSQLQDSSLIYRKLHHSPWTMVASPAHIKQYGLPKEPQDLLQQPSIGLVTESGDERQRNMAHWQGQKIQPEHRFAVNNMNSVISAVKAGLGYGQIPRGTIRGELERKELIELNSDIKVESTSLYLVYPSRSGQPAKVKAFVDAMVAWSESAF